jgi:nitrite reductase/ring-hydroxylating ferredoxin subunit/uncharacterized membrane protein
VIRDLLQGKLFGYPLHPMVVHFPIALFVLTVLIDGAAILLNAGNALVRAGYYTLIGGTVMALIAVTAGLVDYFDIRSDHPAKKTATTHMLLNLTVTGIAMVNVFLRSRSLNADVPPILVVALSAASVAIVMVSGYLGGKMVYEDGIAVGRHRRETPTPRNTILATFDNGLARVGSADRLREGETLRAEIDGYVMAIVRLNSSYYAFQEFCTHRYGPLSEGGFINHEVMCPWHRSCFDVRTGKVTHGPAKEPLKTFEVEVRDGDIYVRLSEN